MFAYLDYLLREIYKCHPVVAFLHKFLVHYSWLYLESIVFPGMMDESQDDLVSYSVRGERQQEGVRSDDEVRTIDESRHGDEYGQESIAR